MSIRDLLRSSRSYRRFREDSPIGEQTLRELVDLTRLCPSAANRQPLKYLISCSPEQNALIFPHLRWAAALTDWPGPAEGERPTGYILILGDTRISRQFFCDHGIAAQSILLGAVERGWGGCMIASIDRESSPRHCTSPPTWRSCWCWPWAHLPRQSCWKTGVPSRSPIGAIPMGYIMFPSGLLKSCWSTAGHETGRRTSA
jgi:nitroreductase